MWYSGGDKLNPEQEFIFKVQMLAEKYDTEVEIDQKNKTVNFLAKDEATQIALAKELEDLFSDNLV